MVEETTWTEVHREFVGYEVGVDRVGVGSLGEMWVLTGAGVREGRVRLQVGTGDEQGLSWGVGLGFDGSTGGCSVRPSRDLCGEEVVVTGPGRWGSASWDGLV